MPAKQMCELPLYKLKYNDLVANLKPLILYSDKHHNVLKCLQHLKRDTEEKHSTGFYIRGTLHN